MHWPRLCVPALALASAGVGAQVLIDPVVVELGARQRSASLTLTLSAKAPGPLTLQSEVLAWAQGPGGESFKPSADLVVVPPIVELKPGESQLVRVAFRGQRKSPAELAYRLMLEEAGTGSPQGGISFRMRYDLPVMVGATEAPRQALQWSSCKAESPDKVCLRLANQGNRRVTLKELAVAGAGWSLPVEAPGTVLAMSTREWQLPRGPGQQGNALSVTGETTRAEPVAARLGTP